MRLCCKVHNRVDAFRTKDIVDEVSRCNTSFNKHVIRQVLNCRNVLQRGAIIKLVKVNDAVIRVLFYQEHDHMASNKLIKGKDGTKRRATMVLDER